MEHKDDYVAPADAAYEPTDVSPGVAARFVVWLAVAAILIHVGLWGLFRLYAAYEASRQPAVEYPLAAGRGQDLRLPPPPRLQSLPVNDIVSFRAEEERLLHSYGWVNRESGIVRIPIEEAMRLTVERGLPARPADPAADPASIGSMPQDSSGGRTYERRTLVPLDR